MTGGHLCHVTWTISKFCSPFSWGAPHEIMAIIGQGVLEKKILEKIVEGQMS